MRKEMLHLGLSCVLVSLSFALLIFSSSVISSEAFDGSDQAPKPQPGSSSADYFMDAPVYNYVSMPEARPPQQNITVIFVAGVIICVAVFIATYCIAYRTIFVRQGDLYRSRAGGAILAEQNSDGAREEEGMDNNGGLEASHVSSLPIVQYSAGMLKEGSRGMKEPHEQNVIIMWVKECAVCLSEYEEGEEMKVLPVCGHCFHKACINMWLFSHTTCPICRLPLRNYIHPAHAAIVELISPGPAGRPPRGLHVAVDI